MTRQLESGDVFQTDVGGVWFVDAVGGYEMARIVCVRSVKDTNIPKVGFSTTTHRQPKGDKERRLIGQAVDFEHASAIVALMS